MLTQIHVDKNQNIFATFDRYEGKAKTDIFYRGNV